MKLISDEEQIREIEFMETAIEFATRSLCGCPRQTTRWRNGLRQPRRSWWRCSRKDGLTQPCRSGRMSTTGACCCTSTGFEFPF